MRGGTRVDAQVTGYRKSTVPSADTMPESKGSGGRPNTATRIFDELIRQALDAHPTNPDAL